jgi:hypothetical protein
MKTILAIAAVLLCSTAQSMAQGPAPTIPDLPPTAPSIAPIDLAAPPPPGKEVEFETCPEIGVPETCVVARYGEDVFNLTGVDPKVPVGKGIKIKGTVETGPPGICTGDILKDAKWEETEFKCAGQADAGSSSPPNLPVK